MRIYISGPITGVENYLEHFKAAEDYWTSKDFSCINPAAVNSMMPKDTTYEEYMKMAFTMLDMCDAVYLLNGWENSRGANREYGYALGKGMSIWKEDDELNTFNCENPFSDNKNEPLLHKNEPLSYENDTPDNDSENENINVNAQCRDVSGEEKEIILAAIRKIQRLRMRDKKPRISYKIDFGIQSIKSSTASMES